MFEVQTLDTFTGNAFFEYHKYPGKNIFIFNLPTLSEKMSNGLNLLFFVKLINVDKLECAFKLLQVIQCSIMKISISKSGRLLRKKFKVSQPLNRLPKRSIAMIRFCDYFQTISTKFPSGIWGN